MANNHPNRTLSLLRNNAAISQSLAMTAKGATLASIYQAKKSGNEDTKVEVLKQQFQSRLEQKITKEPQKITTNAKLLNRYINETSKYIFIQWEICCHLDYPYSNYYFDSYESIDVVWDHNFFEKPYHIVHRWKVSVQYASTNVFSNWTVD